MKFTFFAEYKTFLFRPQVFLALSGAGYAGGPPVHHGASVGPGRAPWRVLWAIKVAKVPTGSLSAELEPTRPVETPKRFFFFQFRSAAAVYQYLLQVQHQPSNALPGILLTQTRYNSSRASSFSPCDRHEPCFCLCVSAIEGYYSKQ